MPPHISIINTESPTSIVILILGSSIISTQIIAVASNGIKRFRILSSLWSCMYPLKKNINPNFENSDGCTVKNPKLSHLRAPYFSTPNTGIKIIASKTIETTSKYHLIFL